MATYRSPDKDPVNKFQNKYYDKYFNPENFDPDSDFEELFSDQEEYINSHAIDTGQVEDISKLLFYPNELKQSNNLNNMNVNPSITTSVLNNKHCTKYVMLEKPSLQRADNSYYSSGAVLKSPKRRITLSPQARYLKNNFYLIFTNRKKFPKTLVKKIHQIIEKPLKLKPFSRRISRFHDLYFVENANDGEKIIHYLVNHKFQIIEQIPELKEYQKK
ncbi:hypothetical protein M9Y10_014904 [Tritrichomonas musculus]|uniref:Uncharacterized protein n=1 Tax=Tritrichomonas musculus TaxID=1915356 RepID=A0ABR2L0X2_9EUKA